MYKIMNVKKFDNYDKTYINWMQNNTNAYIVNTNRNNNSNILNLHKANCHHITTEKGK